MAAREQRRKVGDIRWSAETAFAFDVDLYGQMCDRLGRLFGRLGLECKPRDATPGPETVIILPDNGRDHETRFIPWRDPAGSAAGWLAGWRSACCGEWPCALRLCPQSSRLTTVC